MILEWIFIMNMEKLTGIIVSITVKNNKMCSYAHRRRENIKVLLRVSFKHIYRKRNIVLTPERNPFSQIYMLNFIFRCQNGNFKFGNKDDITNIWQWFSRMVSVVLTIFGFGKVFGTPVALMIHISFAPFESRGQNDDNHRIFFWVISHFGFGYLREKGKKLHTRHNLNSTVSDNIADS